MNFTKEETEQVLAKRFEMNGVIYCDNPLDEDNYVFKLSDALNIIKKINKRFYITVHIQDEYYAVYHWYSNVKINIEEEVLDLRVKFILKDETDLTIYVEG